MNQPKNKKAFILSFPTSVSANEIVAKAKEIGLDFSPLYVHQARSLQRAKARLRRNGNAPATRPPGRPRINPIAPSLAKAVGTEAALLHAIEQLVDARVRRVLAEILGSNGLGS